jgi:hypothetical protein
LSVVILEEFFTALNFACNETFAEDPNNILYVTG